MSGKIILWVSAVMFISYGVVGLISPGVPAGFAGLEMKNGDAFSEVAAMYGGLQTGLGLFCALAALRPDYYRAGLMLLVLGIGSLGCARLISLLVSADPVTGYTNIALAYEFLTAFVAVIALGKCQPVKTNHHS